MPNIFVDHKDRWLALAESESDFAVLFIRAWIPFNAWYCNTYPHHDKKDGPILNEMKGDNNLFRTRVVALLNGGHTDSAQFKAFLGQLHISLENNFVPDATNRITFTDLKYRTNPVTVFIPPTSIRRLNYKAELLANNQVQAVVVDATTFATRFTYSHTKYDLTHFTTSAAFTTLSPDKQAAILNCFNQINPKKRENLLSTDRRNCIDCGGVMFINDANLLSQAIIELLYRLRCILFHGEIQPSKDNLSVYEPTYYMLRLLLKSLK